MRPHSNFRKRFAAAYAVVLLCSSPLLAQTIRPVPEPGSGRFADTYVEYVGRYGEVFKLRDDWQIVPSVKKGIEVVSYYPKIREDLPPESLAPFHPEPSDFAPENFTRLGLIQLAVIPRQSDAFHSLEDLKQAKIRDLKASGVRYEVIEDPFFGPFDGHWPNGTFEISVSAPYRLSQLYMATPSYLCILTSGVDTPPSRRIDMHARDLRYGLAAWIVPQGPRADDEGSIRAILAKGVSLHPFVSPYVWLTWCIFSVFCWLLAGFAEKRRWITLRRISFSLTVFPNMGAVLGGIIGLAAWPFPGFARHFPAAAAIACLLAPVVAWASSRVSGVQIHRRGMIGGTLWAIVSCTFLAYCSVFDWGPGSQYVAAFSAIISFIFYAVGAIVVAALDFPPAAERSLLLLALFTLAAPRAWSQSAPANLDAQARTLLADKGITEASFVNSAKEKLSKTQVLYALQRVEIKGIFSPNTYDNDTNHTFGYYFDKEIAPTHVGEGQRTMVMPDWLRDASNRLMDLKDLHGEAHQRLSEAARTAVEELNGQEINEIVAHSWGTEIVYNAILAGKILPPRRLIVCGMPDRDLEKWKSLSRYTGTEVIVYTDRKDPAAGAARMGGDLTDAGAAAQLSPEGTGSFTGEDVLRNIRGGDSRSFDLQWANACRTIVCNPHQRKAAAIYRPDYQGGTHDRLEYYAAMIGAHDLSGKADEMQAAQDAKIERTTHQLYEAAVRHKREVLEEVAAADVGDSSFFDSAAKGKGISDAVVAMNDEHAALKEEIRRSQERRDQLVRDMAVQKERGIYNYILSALGLACSDPKEFHGQIDHGNSVAVGIDSNLLSKYFAEDMARDGTKSWGARPNSCQALLMQKLIDANVQVTTNVVLQWAAEYREAHPTQLDKFKASVGEFLSAFKSLGGGGDAGGGGSSYSGERAERGSSRSSGGDDGAEAARRMADARERELAKYDGIIHRVFYGDGNPNWDQRGKH